MHTQQTDLIKRYLYTAGAALLFLSFVSILVTASQHFIFPFIGPKVWFMRSMIVLSAACLVPLVITDNRFRYRLSWIHYAIIVYVVALIGTSLFSVDITFSWFDSFERMMGIYTIIHAAAIAFLTPIVAHGWERSSIDGNTIYGWKDVWSVLLHISLMNAVIGIAQYSGATILFSTGGRAYGALGNPIYLGQISAMSTIASVMMAYNERTFKRGYWLVVACICAVSILASGSRGPLLGFMVGSVYSLVALGLYSSKLRKITATFLVSIVLAVILLASPWGQQTAQQIPVIGRALSFDISDTSGRFHAWRVAIKAFKDHPWVGYGHANFAIAFNKHLEVSILGNSYYETWFDNAHNVILNTLATTGAIGFLAWLTMYIAALKTVVSAILKKHAHTVSVIGASAIVITDVASRQFVFENAATLVFFFVAAGFMGSIQQQQRGNQNTKYESKVSRYAVGMLLIAMVLVFQGNIKPAQDNMHILDILKGFVVQPHRVRAVMKDAFDKAGVHKPEVVAGAVRQMIGQYAVLMQQIDAREYEQLRTFLLEELRNVLRKKPHDLQMQLLEIRLASLPTVQPEPVEYYDQRFNELIAYSPNRQEIYHTIGEMLARRGELKKAETYFTQALAIKPNGRGYYYLSKVYALQGDNEKAFENLKRAEQGMYRYDTTERAAEMLYVLDVYKKAHAPAAHYVQEMIEKTNSEQNSIPANVLYSFALTNKQSGLYEDYYAMIKRLQAVEPDLLTEEEKELEKPQTALDKEIYEKQIKKYAENGTFIDFDEIGMYVWMIGRTDDEQSMDELFQLLDSKKLVSQRNSKFYKCLFEHAQEMQFYQSPRLNACSIEKQCVCSYN